MTSAWQSLSVPGPPPARSRSTHLVPVARDTTRAELRSKPGRGPHHLRAAGSISAGLEPGPKTRLWNQPRNQALRPGPGTRNFLVKVFVFLLHSPLVITIPARNLWRVWEAGQEPSESSMNRSLTRWKMDSAKTCRNISGLAGSSGSPVLRPGGSNSHS